MNSKVQKTEFRKKIYRKLDASSISENIPSPSPFVKNHPPKQIIPSSTSKGLREDFKKSFLPLLIDIFELRQMIDTYKSQLESPSPFPLGKISKSPIEILERLETLQNEIKETQRWCEGVILQISKGIKEAKEALQMLNGEEKQTSSSSKYQSFFKKIFMKWKQKKIR